MVVRAAIEELGDDPAMRDDPWLAELRAGLARSYLLAGGPATPSNGPTAPSTRRSGWASSRSWRGRWRRRAPRCLEDGRTNEGIGLLRTSLAMAEEHGLVVPALRARNSLAVGLLADDPRAALETAGVGLEAARRFGFRDLAIRLASNWAEAALDVGEWDGILDLVAELHRADLPLTDRVDFESDAALVLTWRADPSAAGRFAAIDELIAQIEPDLTVATVRGREFGRRPRPRAAARRTGPCRDDGPALPDAGLRTSILWGTVPAARAALWAGDDEACSRAIEQVEDRASADAGSARC